MNNSIIQTDLAKNTYSGLVQAFEKQTTRIPLCHCDDISTIEDILMALFPSSIIEEDRDCVAHAQPQFIISLVFDTKNKKRILFSRDDDSLEISILSKTSPNKRRDILTILKREFKIQNVNEDFKSNLFLLSCDMFERIEKEVLEESDMNLIFIGYDITDHHRISILGWSMKDVIAFLTKEIEIFKKDAKISSKSRPHGEDRFFSIRFEHPKTSHDTMATLKAIRRYHDQYLTD